MVSNGFNLIKITSAVSRSYLANNGELLVSLKENNEPLKYDWNLEL